MKVGGLVVRYHLIGVTAYLDFVYCLFGVLLEPFGPSLCQIAIAMLDDKLEVGPVGVFELINIYIGFLHFFSEYMFFEAFLKSLVRTTSLMIRLATALETGKDDDLAEDERYADVYYY